MVKRGIVSLLVLTLLSAITFAGDINSQLANPRKAKSPASRALILSGTVASDGKTLLSDKDNVRWTITNTQALKGYEGQQVRVKGRVEPGKTEIQVLKVWMKPDVASAARLGDSAFRR